MSSKKYSALEDLEGMEDKLGNEGEIVLERGLSQNVTEVIESFHSYNEVISDMASQTLIMIKHHLEKGYSEQDIVDEFNTHFKHQPYKNIKEIIEHYRSVGI